MLLGCIEMVWTYILLGIAAVIVLSSIKIIDQFEKGVVLTLESSAE